MDTSANADVAAAAAVHRELGPEYTDAVSEGLVERIGSEIDKRVDAGLAHRGQAAPASRFGWEQLTMGLGSIALGVGASAAVLFPGVTVSSSTSATPSSGAAASTIRSAPVRSCWSHSSGP